MPINSGTVIEETVGKYQYWKVSFYDNAGKQKRKRFPHTKQGERDAKKYLAEITKKKANGTLLSTNKTVISWLEEYIQTYKVSGLRSSSLERIMQCYDKIEVSPIAYVPLDKLNGAMVQRFYNTLATEWTDEKGKVHKPLSSSSISKIHKLLVSAYKKAVQLRIIGVNPMDAVEPVKVQTKDMSVFTKEEIAKIFQAIDTFGKYKFNSSQRYNYQLLFQMLLQTGCRIGELLALQWEDVDFEKRIIHISKTKARDTQKLNPPKTRAGRRDIPIFSNDLLAKLKAFRSEGGAIKISGFLFANKNGGAISYQRVFLTWKRICEIAGIGKNIHTFRHTAATYLLEKGVPVAEVSSLLGHADAATTYGMYVHAIPGYYEKIMSLFNDQDSLLTGAIKEENN